MKKVMLASLVALLAGCSTQPKSTALSSENLVGDWVCQTDYTDIDTSTYDIFSMKQDGTFTNDGSIFVPIEKPLFRYTNVQSGTWKLEKDQLTYNVQQEERGRGHSEVVNKLLKSKKKADKEIIAYEKSLFEIFGKSQNLPEKIELTVLEIHPNAFKVKQEMDSKNAVIGYCLRKEVIQQYVQDVLNKSQELNRTK